MKPCITTAKRLSTKFSVGTALTRRRYCFCRVKPDDMNRAIREIYADYRYDLWKVGLALRDLSFRDPAAIVSEAEPLLQKADRLEALIDLYAYLIACQSGGSKR